MIQNIFALVTYALEHHLIDDLDIDYATNQLAWLLKINPEPYQKVEVNSSIDALLAPLLNRAYEIGLIKENDSVNKDLIEAKIMDIFQPRPSDYQRIFDALYTISPKHATDDFYQRSIQSNYIKMARIAKNIAYTVPSPYGEIQITINLSKPEKDPRAIAAALKEKKSSYPGCLLCINNVGYYGSLNHPGRSNHRIIEMLINEEPFYLQYSPYVYYNEHAILLHKEHIPMRVNVKTFVRLFDFIDRFPHYFMGSNAGLPIVGGSILNHEHYQGGCARFPLFDAKVLVKREVEDVTYEILKWPLSVIRLSSTSRERLIHHAEHLRAAWENYENIELGIHRQTNGIPHQAITPILRKERGTYILDVALRNNRTSAQYPDGVFHPHPSRHHIKKENIGLIEVMGLAILPGRLAVDLENIKQVIMGQIKVFESTNIYQSFIDSLKSSYLEDTDLDQLIRKKVGETFVLGLEDCAVFKQDPTGSKAFLAFLEDTLKCLKS